MDRTRRGRRLLVSLCFLCLAVLLPGALLASPAAGRKRRQAGFDHYVLALQWPGTVCRQTNHCCSSNGCCRSNPLNWFTIHGLWPQYSYGGWPSCCRPTTTFNMNKIAMLKPILEKYWPSLYCGDTSTCFGGRGPFWAHEVGTAMLVQLTGEIVILLLLIEGEEAALVTIAHLLKGFILFPLCMC
uniref:Uncharacterized protein n=2 Tax=Aegilops tauschii subsp. strangulata TaxID=200361 RepID=A0A453G555_AEGTS